MTVSDEPGGSNGAPPQLPPTEKCSRGKQWGIVAAIIVPVITGAAVVVPLVVNLNETQTSAATLEVKEPAADHLEVVGEIYHERGEKAAERGDSWWPFWRLPVDAPIDTFPVGQGLAPGEWASCTSEQIGWLDEHAIPAPEFYGSDAYTVEVSNTASTGGSLALENIRFEGESLEVTPRITFSCDAQMGAMAAQMGILDMEGGSAVYSESLSPGSETAPPGSPVTLNVAPGGTEQLQLFRDTEPGTTTDHQGRIVADISEEGETVVLAEEVRFYSEKIPEYAVKYSPALYPSGFGCGDPSNVVKSGESIPDFWEYRDCTPAEAAALLREADAADG